MVSLSQGEVSTGAESVQELEGHLVHAGGLDVQVGEVQPLGVGLGEHVLLQLSHLIE